MTTELFWLTLSALLTGSLWIPFIIGVTGENEDFTDFTRPPDLSRMRPWVHRTYRAHQNAIETFIPFASVVLIAHVAEVSNGLTVASTIAFFLIRVAHALGMISGTAKFPIRPIIFTASYLCTLLVAANLLYVYVIS